MPTTNSTYNQVTVRQDKHGNIELKIPSHYAQQIWNQRQKKINFGGKATDVQDLAEAEKVAEQLQQDLENGTFHPDNLHQYRHPRKRKRNFKVNQSLLELYDHWVDQTKREGCPSGNKEVSKTGEKRYRGQFRRVVQRLPQDFSSKKKQQDIAISLAQNNGRDTQLRILEQLSSLLKWLQDKEMIPDNVPNYFQQLKKEVGKPPRRGCPAALEGKEQFRDDQKIAWTEEERDLIIRAIQQRYIWSSDYSLSFYFTLG